jgi:hypothetical protein
MGEGLTMELTYCEDKQQVSPSCLACYVTVMTHAVVILDGDPLTILLHINQTVYLFIYSFIHSFLIYLFSSTAFTLLLYLVAT